MEVIAHTRKGGRYVFSKDVEGRWVVTHITPSRRSTYIPLEAIHICMFCKMSFRASKLNPFTKKVEFEKEIISSMVTKILVDRNPVKDFWIE